MTETLHASSVAIGGRGVLLLGRSGSGKSDLALRLVDRGALLVSDDGTLVEARAGRLVARAHPNVAGRIEVRGIGIVALPYLREAPVALALLLDETPPRMPDDPPPTRSFAGIALPALPLAPFEASAPVKVEQALIAYGLRP